MDSSPITPRAFLITASDNLEGALDPGDLKHVHKISRLAYLVDAKGGFYLVGDLNKGIDSKAEYCAAPIYDDICGSFGPETKKWLANHGVGIRQTHA